MDHRILVTGGRGGLATAVAHAFRTASWHVDAPGRDALDVADPASVRAWFAGRPTPDLLVCAAGSTRARPLLRLTEADWDRVLADNLTGAARCARAALPAMVRRGGGHIVFVSSWSAHHPPPGQAAYAAAKAGLLGLMRSLAREAGPSGIRVNAILPGFLETNMTRKLAPERIDAVRRAHVLGRFNHPAQVAEFLLFLEIHLPHTSGQVFQLDSRVG
jgi:3-oxoacyl-[acyl-carrier protein] reductase